VGVVLDALRNPRRLSGDGDPLFPFGSCAALVG